MLSHNQHLARHFLRTRVFFLSFFFLSQSTSAQTQSALSLVRKLRDFSKGVLSASGSKEYVENSKSQDPLSFFFFSSSFSGFKFKIHFVRVFLMQFLNAVS